MVSTFPKTFASEVYMMDLEQRLNLLGVLGESLRHHGMRRDANVPQMAGELQGDSYNTTESVSEERCKRWSDASLEPGYDGTRGTAQLGD